MELSNPVGNLACLSHSRFCFIQQPCWKYAALVATRCSGRESCGARSVRPMRIRVLTVGKSHDPGVNSILGEYTKKIERYCSFQAVQVRSNPKKTSDAEVQIEGESDNVMRNISVKDWVVVLDENGRDVTSSELATLIADAGNSVGPSALVFCIGGPYGHGTKVRDRANASIRLSSMVLNHQVALIVLLEQIYRAWTILRGEKYHH